MSLDRQPQPSLTSLACTAFNRAVQGGMYAVTFAQRLADAYHDATPVHERVIEFQVGTTADSQIRAMKHNSKIVERLCNGTIRFPLDLVVAWATALPAPLDLEFRREVARSLGFIGALMPEVGPGGSSGDVAALAAEFGETLQALAPLLADQRIDGQDCPQLIRKALSEGTDLVASWMTLQARLVAALGEGSE